MATTSPDDALADVVNAQDRATFSAENVRVGDHGTFQQLRNININIAQGSDAGFSALSSACKIPDRLSPYFLGRDKELDTIRSAFVSAEGETCPRCVVYGMPGLGKTQLALKYADTAYRESWYPYLFWISATSEEKFVQGYSGILDVISHPGRSQLDVDARCHTVSNWLESQENSGKHAWLIVLDNVRSETLTKMREVLPRRNHSGHILITTRTKKTAEQAAVSFGSRHICIGLEKLDTSTALRLLMSKSDKSLDELDEASLQAATEVVNSTCGLPLTIFQAASFMKATGYDLHQTRDTYRDERNLILGWESEDISTYDTKSLRATYAIALKELQKTSPTTVDLLRVLVFLDPEKIPIELLRRGGEHPLGPFLDAEKILLIEGILSSPIEFGPSYKEAQMLNSRDLTIVENLEVHGSSQDRKAAASLHKLFQSNVKFHQVIQQLQDLSIVVQQDIGSKCYLWLHDLVQEILLDELMEVDTERKFWLARTIQLIYSASRGGIDIVSQTRSLKDHAAEYKLQSITLCQLCSTSALACMHLANYSAAVFLQGWAFCELRTILGNEHSLSLFFGRNLSTIFKALGMVKEAEVFLTFLIPTQAERTARHSQDTMSISIELGWIYLNQARFKEAEKVFTSIDEQKLSDMNDHSMEMKNVRGLAMSYLKQNKLRAAESTEQRAIALARQYFGSPSIYLTRCIADLATIYLQQERFEESEREGLKVLQICDEIGESCTALSVVTIEKLAMCYLCMGSGNEAQTLLEERLEKISAIFGLAHPFSLDIKRTLASTLYLQGKQDVAMVMMKDVVKLCDQLLGPRHPSTLQSRARLELF